MTKFKVGDHVKIINYGHQMMSIVLRADSEKADDPEYFDMSPELIGQTGVIIEANTDSNGDAYAIDNIPQKQAWYRNDQLELV